MLGRRPLNRETATDGARGTPRAVQCPLCGARFDRGQSEACAHCPKLLRSCGMVACPQCFHEFPVAMDGEGRRGHGWPEGAR